MGEDVMVVDDRLRVAMEMQRQELALQVDEQRVCIAELEEENEGLRVGYEAVEATNKELSDLVVRLEDELAQLRGQAVDPTELAMLRGVLLRQNARVAELEAGGGCEGAEVHSARLRCVLDAMRALLEACEPRPQPRDRDPDPGDGGAGY